MSTPTRFSHGIATDIREGPLGLFGMPDPTKIAVFFDDFMTYASGDWTATITQAGAGNGSVALTDAAGGALLLTNDNADNDAIFVQKVGEAFLINSSKRAFFKTRFQVSNATESDVVIGLQITDTTPLDVTDGIYFLKADGSTSVSLVCRKDATTGSTSAAGVATLANATWTELAWAYDGRGELVAYANGAKVASIAATAFLPDTELTVSFGIQNGDANARTMTVDYLFAAVER